MAANSGLVQAISLGITIARLVEVERCQHHFQPACRAYVMIYAKFEQIE
jgi:hypothetical protein